MSKIIYVNAEHGGSDSGAVSGNFIERDINLKVANYCKAYLEGYDCNIVMSRTNNNQEPLIKERNAQVSEIRPACVVTIAHNAGGGDGCEVYYQSGDSKGKSLAEEVITQFTAIGQNSRGAKASNGDYGMCREPSKLGIPAVLGEFAFLDNSKDRLIIGSEAGLKAEGEAYAKAIVNYLGLSRKAQPAPTPTQSPKSITLTLPCELEEEMNIRDDINGNIVGVLNGGTTVYIVNTVKAPNGTLWGRLYFNGKLRYIALVSATKQYVSQDKPIAGTKYRLAGEMNVRNRIMGDILGVLPGGSVIHILRIANASNGTTWGQFNYNGALCWVAVDERKGYASKV